MSTLIPAKTEATTGEQVMLTAVRRMDAWFAEQDAIDKAEEQVRQEIEATFSKLLRRWPAKDLKLPTAVRTSTGWREGMVSTADAIGEEMTYGYVLPELLTVLEESDCPHVQALRDALGKSWAARNASDVAPYRAGVA